MGILNKIGEVACKVFHIGPDYIDMGIIKSIIDMVNEIYREPKVKLFLADYKNLDREKYYQYHVGGDNSKCIEYCIQYDYPKYKECASFSGDENKYITILCGECTINYKDMKYRSYDFDTIHGPIAESYIAKHYDDIESHSHTAETIKKNLSIPRSVYNMCFRYDITNEFERGLVKDALRMHLISDEKDEVDKKLKRVESKYTALLTIKKLASDSICGNKDNEKDTKYKEATHAE